MHCYAMHGINEDLKGWQRIINPANPRTSSGMVEAFIKAARKTVKIIAWILFTQALALCRDFPSSRSIRENGLRVDLMSEAKKKMHVSRD